MSHCLYRSVLKCAIIMARLHLGGGGGGGGITAGVYPSLPINFVLLTIVSDSEDIEKMKLRTSTSLMLQ